jgi:hypothetical protein
MDRRTLALGVAAIAAVAAAAIVTVANGRRTSPKHDATAAYIKSVDTIQQHMQVELTKATKAYRDFAGGKIDAKLEPDLLHAEGTLRTLQRRLSSLEAPPVAARLRRLLLTLAGDEVALADEVGRLAAFSPRFTVLVRASRTAGTELSRALAAVAPPKPHRIRGTKQQVAAAQAAFAAAASQAAAAQADAVDAYDAKAASVAAQLRSLDPPPVMQPAFRAQLRMLARSRTTGAALSAELRKASRSDVAVVARRFTLAARSASSTTAQKAQIAAVKAYNGRVRGIGAMQARIQGELARLQHVTG